MGIIQKLAKFVRQAGTIGEENTLRNGFLSHSAETHSVGYGLGLGAAIALHLAGVPWVLELVLVALGGVGAGRKFKNKRVMREITDEPQYFLGALVAGFSIAGFIIVLLKAGVVV